jgi:hypothetical protein
MTRSLRTFCWCVLLVLTLGIGLRLAISAREWFIKDDFFFLAMIQNSHWTFREALLPTRTRLIAAYRPIGLDAYFLLNFALYGWNALGYYVTGLVLQALSAWMLVRMALGYRLDPRVALSAGALVLLAAPSTLASYAVAEHNYICAATCYSVCLTALLAELRRPRLWQRLLSYAVLTLGLLSNEVCATLPAVALLAAYLQVPGDTRRVRLRSAAGATWPYFVIAGLYIDFKLSGVPSRQRDWFYDVDVSSDMLGNLFGNLAHVHGGAGMLVAVAAAAALVVWATIRGKLAPLGTGAKAAVLVGSAWMLATSLPFAVLALPASRFALLQLPAAVLLWAVILDTAIKALRPQLQSYALLAAIVLLTPWPRMLHALDAPRGAAFRRAYEVVARDLPASESSCVTIVCDSPELASRPQCEAFRDGTFGGALWRAVVPERWLDIEFTDETTLNASPDQFACLRYYLTPELALTHEPPRLARARASTR